MNVVMYLRAGSGHVATASLEHQSQRITSYAATRGHRIVGAFADVGYVGAGLWAALEVLARGEAQALLIHDRTRLLRGYPDVCAPLRMLRELHKPLLTARCGEIALAEAL